MELTNRSFSKQGRRCDKRAAFFTIIPPISFTSFAATVAVMPATSQRELYSTTSAQLWVD
jgi:hypothetical protein